MNQKGITKKYYKYVKKPSADPEGRTDFFCGAFRYYFLLDIPAEQAFYLFCEVAGRGKTRNEIIGYLVSNGMEEKDALQEIWSKASFDAREKLESKFEYLSKLIIKGE